MDINELREYADSLGAEADHLESLMLELDNDRQKVLDELELVADAITKLQPDWQLADRHRSDSW